MLRCFCVLPCGPCAHVFTRSPKAWSEAAVAFRVELTDAPSVPAKDGTAADDDGRQLSDDHALYRGALWQVRYANSHECGRFNVLILTLLRLLEAKNGEVNQSTITAPTTKSTAGCRLRGVVRLLSESLTHGVLRHARTMTRNTTRPAACSR